MAREKRRPGQADSLRCRVTCAAAKSANLRLVQVALAASGDGSRIQLNPSEILARLSRIEQALFPSHHAPSVLLQVPSPAVTDGVADGESTKNNLDCLSTPSAEAGYPEAPDVLLPQDCGQLQFQFQVAKPVSAAYPSLASQCPWGPETAAAASTGARCVVLLAKEEFFALFDNFVGSSNFLPRAFHLPSARVAINNFFSSSSGNHIIRQDGNQTSVASVAAFILSICAASAFFWEPSAAATCTLFSSKEDASRQARAWLSTAWELLDQLRQIPGSASLVQVQASVILSDLIYNMEGCSSRFRCLHYSALALAREISLHLIDAPGPVKVNGSEQDGHLTEVKRRVWWHIASTDWLQSIMGGQLDRTYSVQPQHMRVNRPSNVNERDPSCILPATMVTDMTYPILRTRLAEACRQVTDALPLGAGDIDDLPYDRVLTIAQLFDGVFTSMPPCFALGAPIPPEAPHRVNIERRVIQLAFHSRRARIFRPFLLSNKHKPHRGHAQQADAEDTDPRFAIFRTMCLSSARAVLAIGSSLIRESLGDNGKRRGLLVCSGCIISHLFATCVLLIAHPALAPHGGDAGNAGDSEVSEEAETIRTELADARRLLEKVAEISSAAGNLVRKLIGVLGRHRALAEEAAGISTHGPGPTTKRVYASGTSTTNRDLVNQGSDYLATAASGNTLALPTPPATSFEKSQQASWNGQQRVRTHSNFGLPEFSGSWDSTGDFGSESHSQPPPLGLLEDIEWADLMMNTSSLAVGVDGWNQLFADLDAAFPQAAPL
ncbi:hypothetical protein B0T26DRAFT_757722 [Lasiosphaeria miniovina]|uniref:Xylanolytic transcriptional activator regulatory domain-containing protein n=1 Tax=Lasiosphaeria miniovina TaxID=1954250 RepID=A0AA39ZQK6_9PEZI|nr:uncharacterized protein B0T26DRAFT_757722 [Lasiosphaeria miniovina]KAK0701728.1 hypothetical protein B0T26DRAFT_757722 [Lasiosphaeria miniovina]